MVPKRLLKDKEYVVKRVNGQRVEVSVSTSGLFGVLWKYAKSIGMSMEEVVEYPRHGFYVIVPPVADVDRVADDIRRKAEQIVAGREKTPASKWTYVREDDDPLARDEIVGKIGAFAARGAEGLSRDGEYIITDYVHSDDVHAFYGVPVMGSSWLRLSRPCRLSLSRNILVRYKPDTGEILETIAHVNKLLSEGVFSECGKSMEASVCVTVGTLKKLYGRGCDSVEGVWERKVGGVAIIHRESASRDGGVLEVNCKEECVLNHIIVDLQTFGIDVRHSALHPLRAYVYPEVDLEELAERIAGIAGEYFIPF